ncbi:MarR family winged helix-turn-helix transcriptional regulator [Brevundimonas sp. FT23042]|uniref:MarR family winged helix-turn-helix transcriptional regulator n=1 Tax=Brevundimonas sp. FT23042 TaxID=3393749 RepID=UPI003B58918E
MSNLPEPYATTLHIRDHCLCLHAQQAARALSRRFDEVFRPLGLTSGQFSLLNSLNRPSPPTISQVAGTLGMDRSTVTANLKPLERSGAVIATVDASDRRGRRVALTSVGRDLLARATPIWIATHRQLEAELDAGEADRMRGGLRRLLEA